MKFLSNKITTHGGVALLAATVAALAGIGATANKTSIVQVIYVQNKSSFVSDAELKNDLPAFQTALSKDFAPIWKVDGKLVYLPRTTPVPAGAESITLVDHGNVQGALAYHELVNGVPDSIIYVGTSKYYGYNWTVGFTHELFEMLADPGLNHTAQDATGKIWAQEICDPVESDADGFPVPGLNGKPVQISDFVTEKWAGALTSGPYDYMNHIQAPLVIDKGGYAQWWDGFSWHVITNFEKGSFASKGIHW